MTVPYSHCEFVSLMAKYVKIGDYKCPLQSLCVPYGV